MRALGVLFLVIASWPTAALADALAEPVVERSHEVSVAFGSGMARATVTRVFENTSSENVDLSLSLELPEESFADGLRARVGSGAWHEARFEDAEVAHQYLDGSTGPQDEPMRVEPSRKIVLLEWLDVRDLELRMSTLAPGESLTVEYRLTLPLVYADGYLGVHYPTTAADNLAAARVRLETPIPGARHRRAQDLFDLPEGTAAVPYDDGAGITLAGEHGWLEVPARGIDVVSARLGQVALSSGEGFVRLQLEVASPLVPTPREPVLVFLLDASHSMGADGIARQLHLIETVLSRVPDARVEIVAYDRHARRLLGELRRGRDLDREHLALLAPEPRNGSALDAALELAAQVVADAQGETRIIALSDTLLRPSWDGDEALRALTGLAPEVVVHVVQPIREGIDRERDDTHVLAPLALGHGGVYLQLSGFGRDADAEPSELAALALELVRPTGLDHVRLEGIDPALFPWLPERLEEGEGVSDLVALDAAHSGPVVLRGELWSTPFERVFETSEDFSRATAGFVLASDRTMNLSEDMERDLGLTAGAVSSQTSLLVVIEEERCASCSSASCCNLTTSWTHHHASVPSHVRRVAHVAASRVVPDVLPLLAPGVDACLTDAGLDIATAAGAVELTLDTTRDEVVDAWARVLRSDVPGAQALATCIAEAAWATRLDDRFDLPHERFVFVLPAERSP